MKQTKRVVFDCVDYLTFIVVQVIYDDDGNADERLKREHPNYRMINRRVYG